MEGNRDKITAARVEVIDVWSCACERKQIVLACFKGETNCDKGRTLIAEGRAARVDKRVRWLEDDALEKGHELPSSVEEQQDDAADG